MTEDLFDDPGGNRIEWADYLGKLLLIWPLSQETVKTEDYGEKDAIRADIVVVDGDDGPEDLPDILIFPLVLQGKVRRHINTGKCVIGRLGQGKPKLNSRGEEKQKPPWDLLRATDEDRMLARKYLAEGKARPTTRPAEKFDDVPF